MASTNPNAVANQGEFHARRPRDDPLTTKGHQPGQHASPADAVPEFSAQTLPAGSAPSARTFAPNTTNETPSTNDAVPRASDTLAGASSADVHAGYGHPGQGQTSREMRQTAGNTAGVEGVKGEGVHAVGNKGEEVHGRHDLRQRGLGSEEAGENAGRRGGVPAAEERTELNF